MSERVTGRKTGSAGAGNVSGFLGLATTAGGRADARASNPATVATRATGAVRAFAPATLVALAAAPFDAGRADCPAALPGFAPPACTPMPGGLAVAEVALSGLALAPLVLPFVASGALAVVLPTDGVAWSAFAGAAEGRAKLAPFGSGPLVAADTGRGGRSAGSEAADTCATTAGGFVVGDTAGGGEVSPSPSFAILRRTSRRGRSES